MSQKKRWAVVGGVLLLAALVALFVSRRGSDKEDQGPDNGVADSGKRRGGAALSNRAERIDPRTANLGSISGSVKDTKGKAIADALVCTRAWSNDLSSEDTREPICTKTDAAGRYQLKKLMAANHAVSAGAPHHLAAYHRGKDDRSRLRLAAGEHLAGIDIVLRGGAIEVRGVVSDIGGGGVAGALVTVRNDGRWRNAASITRTNDKGEFKAWAEPGGVDISAHAEGYAEGSKEAVVPGQLIEVLLTPESVLAGRVIDAVSKEPVANASVTVGGGDWRWDRGSRSGSAYTDAKGRFRLTRLRPGRYKPVARSTGRYGRAKESVLLGLAQTRDDVLIEVHPAFVVSAKIVIGGDKKPCDSGWASLRRSDGGRGGSANTDADGSVRFRALMPGTYKVSVGCRDYLPKDEYPDLIVADKDVSGLVWEVDSGATIRGRVITKAGKPVPHANVRARSTGGAPRGQRKWGWGETKDDGSFELEGLLKGAYRVSVHTSKFPDLKDPIELDLSKGDPGPIEIVLDSGGKIEGTVVDEDGKPVSNVRVSAIGKTQRWGWGGGGRSIDDGSFSVEGLQPGEYRVVARRGWSDTLRKPGSSDDDVHGELATVKSGEVARVKLTVESQSGTISGKVVDANGKPVQDAFVSAERESDAAGSLRGSAQRQSRWSWGKKPVLTDTSGAFKLERLSKGNYTVRAYRRGGGEAFTEGVALGSDVTVTIKSTGSIVGTVRTGDGSAPDEFTITASDRSTGFNRRERFFRTKGEWAIRDLPAGKFTVVVDAPEGSGNQEVPLTQGQNASGIIFTLESKVTIVGTLVGMEDGKPIPNMSVRATAVKAGSQFTFGGRGDKKHITDESGKFEIEKAPAGRIYVTVFPMDWEKSEYSFTRVIRTIKAGSRADVGTIQVPRRRLASKERAGDLGFKLKEQPPDIDPSDRKLVVSFIRPGSAATDSGLEVGDEIIEIDGRNVTGENAYLYYSLSRVPPGTNLKIALARGKTISITATKPL